MDDASLLETVVMAIVFAGALLAWRLWGKDEDPWLPAATQLGLESRADRGPRIEGTYQGWQVRAETFTTGDEYSTTSHLRTMVYGGSRIPDGITLKPEGVVSATRKIFSGEDIVTGDAGFDSVVHVSGDETVAIAFLGREARGAIQDLIQRGGGVREGCLYLEQKGSVDPADVIAAVQWLTSVATRVAMARTVPEALADNALHDPDAAVRVRNLEVLVDGFSAESETRRVSQAALPMLRAIIDDRSSPPGVLERAILNAARLGDVPPEDALLQLLQSESAGVRHAAAVLLGHAGTVRAVEPLLRAGGAAAGESIRRIQARLPHAERGALTLASPSAEGALSVGGSGGELSIPEKTKA